jgi:VCBS repeat-containing protein
MGFTFQQGLGVMISRYFLLIDGLNGGSHAAGHEGWFEIDSFDFDISDVIATATGTGGGEGKVTFSPLTVQLSLDPGLAEALRDAATGAHIAIKLEGVTSAGEAVYDLTLAGASVTQLHEGNGGNDSVSFSYGQVGLITQVQHADGSTAPGASFGYDVARNLPIDAASLPKPSPNGGNPLTAELVSSTSHGALTLNPDGSFIYVPAANFNGTDSFVYHADDGSRTSNDVTVLIDVAPVNDAPVITSAPAHVILTETDLPLSALGQVTFTDVDIGDTPMASVDLTTAVATATGVTITDSQKASLVNGFSITNSSDGHWSYSIASPDFLPAGSSIELSYPVTVDDRHGSTASQAVTITINGTNDAPAAFHDIAGVHPKATTTTDAAHGVLANDTDPDIGNTLSVTAVTFGNTTSSLSGGHATINGSFGSLVINSDGSYSYSANKLPPSTSVAQDTFTYTVNDGHGGTAQSTLTVTIGNDQYIAGTPGETLVAGNSKQVLDGGLGNVTINGGNGADVLIGGPHDTLTGGNGPDTYVFGPGFGLNIITDFNVHNDQIQIDHSLFANVSAVMAHTADDARGNAVITYDANDTITFLNINSAQLQAHPSDFHLV